MACLLIGSVVTHHLAVSEVRGSSIHMVQLRQLHTVYIRYSRVQYGCHRTVQHARVYQTLPGVVQDRMQHGTVGSA